MTEGKAQFNLDHTFHLALEQLKQADPEQVCQNTGASYAVEQQAYSLSYLHTTVTVTLAGEITCAQKQLTLQEQILILHYLLSAKKLGPQEQEQLISFKELPGGEMYYAPFTKRAIKPFLAIFAAQPDKLLEVAKAWGGEAAQFGDVSICLPVFAKVKIYYVLWQGDDEFPANATILFPAHIGQYFSTEDVAVLTSQLVYQMADLVR